VGRCVPWGGACDHGELVPFPYMKATGVRVQDDHCGTCDKGYHCGGKQHHPAEWRDGNSPACDFTSRSCMPWNGTCPNGDLIGPNVGALTTITLSAALVHAHALSREKGLKLI